MVKKLLYLNGLAAISVVLYHATQWGYLAMFFDPPIGMPNLKQVGSVGYYGLVIMDQLGMYAIPVFIFVSGYFTSIATAQKSKAIEWRTVLSRIKILIVPFLIWSVLNLLFKWFLGERYGLLDSLLRIVTGRAASRFYYIPLLVQLYLLAPVLVVLIQRWPKTVMVVSAILQIFVYLLRYVVIFHPDWNLFEILSSRRFFPAYIFSFVFGIFVGINLPHIKAGLVKYKRLFLTAIVFFFFLGIIEGDVLFRLSNGESFRTDTIIDQIYSLFIILTFLTFEKVQFPLFEQMADLGIKSYGIYLIHTFALTTIAKLMYRFLPSITEYQIIFLPIMICGGFALPLLLMYLVEKTPLRKYYRSLFG